ncbi:MULTISPECIES: type IV secretory system conjugative DNA transfer family protein [unclassified Crossiella]|uniref:type IV secretory system conjugative DNA transfer family protein n=1 Tax=unclassified Crossiella TaxID=2620835 RepID=UPI001FFE6234|nr:MULTISPECIES: TraM recognition domain-containing protein [unclassified Crossiella]MCK2239989.1 TraM recognition domain-containing protein [Crossiella sp. S99.2]MCK2252697.1 TraM recognition domain-containing protein [Crossiella sp. S99.1]
MSGKSRLFTRRERYQWLLLVVLGVLAAVAAAALGVGFASWWDGLGWQWPRVGLRPLFTGDGSSGLLGLPRGDQPLTGRRQFQFPVSVVWAGNPWLIAGVAGALWLGWFRYVLQPLHRLFAEPARHQHLAGRREIRAVLGVRAARRTGAWTWPSSSRWQRWWMPVTAFAWCVGYPKRGGWQRRMWVNFEWRARIVAGPGWGKTERALVRIVRQLPGGCMVCSIEPGIFTRTVLARRFRRQRLRWWWLSLLARPWLPRWEAPVAVVDFTSPDARQAAGWPEVKWNLLIGCESITVATRYAEALVTGVEAEQKQERGSGNDKFFRDSAGEVVAAWLHAARLGGLEISDILVWLGQVDHPQPRSILESDERADSSALSALNTHLDGLAGTTTSGVKRYVSLALRALASRDGQRMSGSQHDPDQFDIRRFIAEGGTLYLLADPTVIDRVRPLLSLFAAEVFRAGEQEALAQPAPYRLPQPFIGVVDELRAGITIPDLPYTVTARRKYGIGVIYAVQSASQEDALYGAEAEALRSGARVSVVGGLEMSSASELTRRAGVGPVVVPTHADRLGGRNSETVAREEILPISDQQRLRDGEAVLAVHGLPLMVARLPSTYEQWWLARRLRHEAAAVSADVVKARSVVAPVRREPSAAARAAGFGAEPGAAPLPPGLGSRSDDGRGSGR